MKRIFDIIVSLLLILIMLPVGLVLSLLIIYGLGRPVLFRQVRIGLNGQPFEMVKFRTMLDKSDPQGDLLPDSERLTKFGILLRSTSLDELPELWNVLKGEMSLVGPRPLFVEYLFLYSIEQARRHAVKPGITGWAQINGRNAIGWEERFELDVWYVDNQSFWLDLKILILTLKRVLSRDGVSQVGNVTMEKFRGSIK